MPRIQTGIILRLPCAHCGRSTPHHVTDAATRCLTCEAVAETKEPPPPAGGAQKETRDMETGQPRNCHIHGIEVAYQHSCPRCLADFETRPNADAMTGDERAMELEAWYGILEIPFDKMHQRFEELLGRPVWTHEMGLNKDGLVSEARDRQHPSMDAIIELIPEEKRMIVVMDDESPVARTAGTDRNR